MYYTNYGIYAYVGENRFGKMRFAKMTFAVGNLL